jgi:hypothetical protein
MPMATAPETGQSKAKVFISYSRKDIAFADRIDAALKAHGFETLIDRRDIVAFEPWWQRVEGLIGSADTVVFVLSPNAVRPDSVARKEVAFAAKLNKRFAPIVYQPVEDKLVPEELAKLNFIFFDEPARFEQSADNLAEALNTDIGWVRQHTDFGEQARRWARAKGASGLLLRSPALEQAERWIASRPPSAPAPTEETQAFIRQSRQGATRRRNVLTGSLAAGLVLALALAGIAYWQRGLAIEQRTLADEQRKQALEQRNKALLTQSRLLADRASQSSDENDAGTGMLLAIEALPDSQSGVQRPYAAEAEVALFSARNRLQERFVLGGHEFEVWDATFSPDGELVVTGSQDKNAAVWDAATGKRRMILKGHALAVTSASFSPDGRKIVTGSGDHSIRIWDAITGETIRILEGHEGTVWSASFSSDGQRIVFSSVDKTARIWNAETGKLKPFPSDLNRRDSQ